MTDSPPKNQPKYTGPDGKRLRWVETAIDATRAWIDAEAAESAMERSFSSPGDWDSAYNTDIILQTKQAEHTVQALQAERDLILRCQAGLRRETARGDYDDFAVEVHPYDYAWRTRFPDAELLESHEGGAVYAAAAEGVGWIIFDEGTMFAYMDAEDAEDAAIAQTLVTIRRYGDITTWHERVAAIREQGADA